MAYGVFRQVALRRIRRIDLTCWRDKALDGEHHRAFLESETNNLLTVFNLDTYKAIAYLPKSRCGECGSGSLHGSHLSRKRKMSDEV